jgi:hypothetical protein
MGLLERRILEVCVGVLGEEEDDGDEGDETLLLAWFELVLVRSRDDPPCCFDFFIRSRSDDPPCCLDFFIRSLSDEPPCCLGFFIRSRSDDPAAWRKSRQLWDFS